MGKDLFWWLIRTGLWLAPRPGRRGGPPSGPPGYAPPAGFPVRPRSGRGRAGSPALAEGIMARVGRLLVAAAVLGSGVDRAWADLNRSHVFNPRWTPHARFHAASAVATDVGWSIASLWLLRRPGTRDEHQLALKIAALHPILSYAPFFIAVAVPGSEPEDEP